MAALRAELARTLDSEAPYKIIIWRDDLILVEIPVRSVEAATDVARDILAKLEAARNA